VIGWSSALKAMVLTMENPLPIATMNDVDDNYVVRWIRRKKKEKVRNRKDEDSLVLFAEDIEDITHLIWWLVVVISTVVLTKALFSDLI
jgi:hypothetical protein